MTFLESTRAAYDTIAPAYAEQFHDGLDGIPVERALLGVFAELVRSAGSGRVADIGCGTGTGTADLRKLGLDVFGVDLSPGMLAFARERYPELSFTEASMTALPIADEVLAGIAAQYSIIHIPDGELPGVLAEFHRVLRPGGQLLLFFMDRDEHVLRTEAFGLTFALDYYFRSPEVMTKALERNGFDVHITVRRKTQEGENIPRGMIIARKPRL
ncbi:methyltransferase domain-containing protein [Hamadaea sp. NPDC050747]|uniref:class I SAM-dependent DNA methyltransferase n=1 Tax=Hamadaea sp. NPDC050747 TaxID=3155789 RepID=UPI0033E5C2DE